MDLTDADQIFSEIFIQLTGSAETLMWARGFAKFQNFI